MKKKKTILQTLLLPYMLVILLCLVASCSIFYYTVSRNAMNEAKAELTELKNTVIPIMNEVFTEDNGLSPRKKTRLFVKAASPILSRTSSDVKFVMFSETFKVVYPKDETDKELAAPVSQMCKEYIQQNGNDVFDKVSELTDSDDKRYLVQVYEVPIDSKKIRYLAAYRPISLIGDMVKKAVIRVIAISIIISVILLFLLCAIAGKIIRPTEKLCNEAKRIGEGDFSAIKAEFGIKEFDELKSSMDTMSDRLKTAENTQRTFYQNISHDLRTPLMSIGGYAQGIETGVLEDYRHAAHVIAGESARLTGLVEGMLTLSRLESSEKPELQPVDLGEVIEEVTDSLNGLAIKNKVELILDIQSNNCRVWGSEELLLQITENLVSNALRYAASRVYVSVRDSEHKDMLKLMVTDDGNGINADDLPHIFERRYKGSEGSFGFGLAIASAAAHSMDAVLTAENVKDGGASFELEIKRADKKNL